MFQRSRPFSAHLLLALLSASPALSQARPSAPSPRPAPFVEALRSFLPDFLTRLFEGGGSLAGRPGRADRPATSPKAASLHSSWADLGCSIDPYGHCLNVTQQSGGH
jgi:hypothetical protein